MHCIKTINQHFGVVEFDMLANWSSSSTCYLQRKPPGNDIRSGFSVKLSSSPPRPYIFQVQPAKYYISPCPTNRSKLHLKLAFIRFLCRQRFYIWSIGATSQPVGSAILTVSRELPILETLRALARVATGEAVVCQSVAICGAGNRWCDGYKDFR